MAAIRESLPERIGKYEILKRLARGGMAEVFLGQATAPGGFRKLVAIKRILPHLALDQSFAAMFIDEARITAQLNHSNIAQIFEFGQSGSNFFIAMEYVQGLDLRALINHFRSQNQAMPPAMAAFFMVRVMSALGHAHNRRDSSGRLLGIIHRDVSPSNVLVTFEGEVKLIDFGIAKAAQRFQETAVGMLKGKSAYLSPEQIRGRAFDHRSDIFSAGAVLFELLTGDHPFRSTDEMVTMERILKAQHVRPCALVPQVPPALEAICLRALARRPGDRYQQAEEMEAELELYHREAPLGRHDLAAWMRRHFPEPKAELGLGEGAGGLSSRLHPDGAARGSGQPDTTPTPLQGGFQTPDHEAIKDLPTAPAAHSAPAPLEPRTPTPTTQSLSSGEASPSRPPRSGRNNLRLFTVGVLAFLVLGAVAVQVVFMVRRGPRLLPLPAASRAVTEPIVSDGARGQPDSRAVSTESGAFIIRVEGQEPVIRCLLSVDGVALDRQEVPCRFNVDVSARLKLTLKRPGYKPLSLEWTARGDRTLKVQSVASRRRLVVR